MSQMFTRSRQNPSPNKKERRVRAWAKIQKSNGLTILFNPWRGCAKVSAGCKNCYAETMAARNPAVLGEWGDDGTRIVASESMWAQPLRWDAAAKKAGERHRVFCASMADIFEPREELIDPRKRLFRLIHDTPNLDWLLLTKRPEFAAEFFQYHDWTGEFDFQPWPNMWIGTSVENQETADERIPHLLRVPAAVRFVSAEPLLGPVDLRRYLCDADEEFQSFSRPVGVDWVIAGGESGPNARPMHPDWARSLRDQCAGAGVPFFFKQWGEYQPVTPIYDGRDESLEIGDEVIVKTNGGIHNTARDGQPSDFGAWFMRRIGKRAAGRVLDGRTWDEMPSGEGGA